MARVGHSSAAGWGQRVLCLVVTALRLLTDVSTTSPPMGTDPTHGARHGSRPPDVKALWAPHSRDTFI